MDYLQAILLVFVGVIAGFINTVAGGGSLLSLPILIFLGLPPSMANGTNRVAIFLQNILGIAGFKSKGIFIFPYSLWVGLSALMGAILGAQFSVQIRGDLFNHILAVVMVAVVLITIFNPIKNLGEAIERLGKKHQIIGVITFFFIGIYGGFIQAGVGFIIMGSLTMINRISLVKSNSIKVFVVFTYTIAALAVFIIEDQINWVYGLTLAAGNMTGAWIASRWSVGKGDVWIRRFMIVMVTVLAIKLWFS
ncbi:MAG: sulfite exporter TauE/SafE family protein [Cyclobacteriaceae bacterium]|nr:sulfite exporter TauE/SafE family protein [Cyclobacteriaceae bacterium]